MKLVVSSEISLWPKISENPNCERVTPYLLSSSFPTLFPCSSGDVTCDAYRITTVSYCDAFRHYLRYYDAHVKEYSLAKNSRFLHYIQDFDERSRIQSQCSIYMQKNPSDTNMSVADLKEAMRKDGEAFAISNRMSKYGANILGSASYFVQRKKELISLIESKGSPTFWFTLSLPNYHWEGFKRFSEEQNLDAKKWFHSNQHLVNEYFIIRTEIFFDVYFGKNGMQKEWHWMRYEWQKRGNCHIHGMIRLKTDPNFTELAEKVVAGRKAIRLLKKLIDTENVTLNPNLHKTIESAKSYLENNDDLIDEEALQTLVDKNIDGTIKESFLENLCGLWNQSEIAEWKIISFRNYFLSSYNSGSEREPARKRTKKGSDEVNNVFVHPSSVNEEIIRQSGFNLLDPRVQKNYCELMEHVQRHRHNMSYCWRNNKCRFNFPKQIQNHTVLQVKDVLYQRGENKGKLKNTTIELKGRTNDGWLNQHSPLFLSIWGANCDLSLIIDRSGLTQYIAKYCNKVEGPSVALQAVIRQAANIFEQDEGTNAKRILRRTFNRITGRRDKTVQEITHLLNSNSYVSCSHQFYSVSLYTQRREINLDKEEQDEQVWKDTFIDLYLKRSMFNNWKIKDEYNSNKDLLDGMTLTSFATKFTVQKGKIVSILATGIPIVIMFSPDIRVS